MCPWVREIGSKYELLDEKLTFSELLKNSRHFIELGSSLTY
jgi:hypothetical protein